MSKILMSILLLAKVNLGFITFGSNSDNKKPPQLDPDEWWGPETLEEEDISIRPFHIVFSSEMIEDLRNRLRNHRPFTSPLSGTAFEYGFNANQLDIWVKYWAEEYPFKEREAFFNQYPQYLTNIQGLDIHFILVKPEDDVETIPLLMLHGWPGSIREFYEIIPLLTKPAPGYNFAFEVIVPSLPGYGYSDGPIRPGLGTAQMAMIIRNLMNRIGFEKYYVHAGDWGASVASAMVTLYPDEILGLHSNFLLVQSMQALYKTILADYVPTLVVDIHKPHRMASLHSYFEYIMEEFGYFHIQATKPDTVGIGIGDSPSGLLAYMLEKFGTGTRLEHRHQFDGGLNFRFTKEQLIDNLMMYWAPNSFTTAVRLFAEEMSRKNFELDLNSYSTPVPAWALQAKHEIFYQPPSIIGIKYTNLLGTTLLDDGGHFLTFELPYKVAEDVFKAVNIFRAWKNKYVHREL